MASEDFESTLIKKARELKELQALQIGQLEDALIKTTTELEAHRKHVQCLQEDFQFNLKLLEERDHKLECYDAMIMKFQVSDSTRQEEMSELHVHIGKLQETVMQGKKQYSELLTMHQQKMAKLQLHLDKLSSEKTEEIHRLKEENEDLKNSLRLKQQVSEGELALQKQEMMAFFDVEMRKQEHEFNLKYDDLCSEVLSYKLKVELLNKELEVHTKSHNQASQALQASEDQCYQAQKEIQHKDWVLKNIASMKDARIQELEDQLRQMEHKHEMEKEKACRVYAELEGHAREKESTLTQMCDVHAEQLCEAETRERALQTKLDGFIVEQTMRDKNHAKECQKKEQEILRLQSELQALRSSWDTYITQMSKDMVIKDTALLTEREQVTKLKEELDKCSENVKRYKQQLANGLQREQTLEQKLVQLELDWKKHYEDVRAEDYIKDKELVESLTFSRDKAVAALHDKDEEIKEMNVLLNALSMERAQTSEGTFHRPQHHSQTSEVTHSSSEISKLQKQNASLRAVVAEMRKEMENLTKTLSPSPMASNTQDMKTQPSSTDVTDNTHATKKELKELKGRCFPFDDCPEESMTITVTSAPSSAATENLVRHMKTLSSTIKRLQVEKWANLAALKEKQDRIAFLETVVGHFSHQTTGNEKQLRDLFSKKRWKEDGKVEQGLFIEDSTLPEQLRQAVWWMSRLSKEKQQLIELGNCLRAQLAEARLKGTVVVPAREGKRQDCDGLSTLEHLQYQLTSQELQYAQRDHTNKSFTVMRPLVSVSQHEGKQKSSQSNQETQGIHLCRKDSTQTMSSAFKSSTIPSSPWMSSIDTDGSLQDVWQILEKGLSPSVLTPTGSAD